MRVFKVILAAALLLAMMAMAVPGANAQLNITWSTGFQIQNLSASTANVSITFYQQNGTALTPYSDTLSPNGSKTYSVLNGTAGPSVPAGFNGSAVISADQPVAAILNISGNNFAYGGSASGISAGATKVSLPLIQKNNGGFDTWCSIQNAGTAAASVSVTFAPRDASSGNAHTTAAVTVQPGAAMTIDTTAISQLGSRFVGAATVNSPTQPVAAICNQTGLGASKTLLTYDGFGGGSTNVRVPLVQNGNGASNNLFASGISIQNVGTATTNITVQFSPNTRGTFQPQTITFNNVAAGQTKTINTANATTNANAPGFGGNTAALRYVGSATITSSGQPLVAVVNQIGASSTGSSYEGYNPANGTAKVSLPLLMANNGGFNTAFQCQNVGNTNATITVQYGPNRPPLTFVPANVTQSIAAGQAGAPISQAAASGGNRYVGSARVTSNGAPIVCVGNQLGTSTTGADVLLTYDGTNY